FSTRFGRSSERSSGAPIRTRRTSRSARRANRVSATAATAAKASAEKTVELAIGARARQTSPLHALRLPELRRDRGHDLVQVTDHRIVGAREDRSLGIGVDR